MDDPIADFKRWYMSKPIFTRTYLLLCFILTALISLKFVSPFSVYYTFQKGFTNLQLWRIPTSYIFMGKFSFGFIFQMMFAYMALNCVQTQIFDHRTYADFLWMIIYLSGSLLLIASIIDLYFLTDSFIFALIYIWCKRRPYQTIRMMFSFQVKSAYFPWVYMGIKILMGDSFWNYFIGLLLGHLYITIKDIFTAKYHRDFLKTPRFFKRLVNRQTSEINGREERNFNGPGARIE